MMNVVVVQGIGGATATEPVIEEKLILNVTFIHCQHYLSFSEGAPFSW